MIYLVSIDDGGHNYSTEFDTLEEARADYKETIEFYSQPDASPIESVVLEDEDYEIIEEHSFL